MIGQTISHYKILSRLGAGGMGEVFLAEDTKLDRQVALKFLPVAMWNDADAHQRLIREAKAASQLDHPNIVTIYGIEELEGRPFIVMAHVSGATLDKYLASRSCTIDELVGLTLQIIDGLGHAHDAGVIHRDLKPANILVDDRGRVRILDFGLAWMRGAARLTHTGSIVGTLAYSPPELIQGSEANPASDIYSLGVVLYQMLTGHLPFQAQREEALMYSILQEDPPPVSAYNPSIPGSLQAVIGRCLEKQPAKRFANCAEMGASLRNCRSFQLSGAETPLAPDTPSVAVLPFANRSASSEDEYFSDGLADELRNTLAKIRGLRVAAGASSFQFKGRHEDLSVIGQKLNVATLLDGSVRKSGDRVRISVELVKASDGRQLWSETYDRALDDIFAVQDDIAHSVVNELRTTLLGEERDSDTSRVLKAEVMRAALGRGQNAEAHRLFLQGRHLIDRPNPENLARGIDYLKQASGPGFRSGLGGARYCVLARSRCGLDALCRGIRKLSQGGGARVGIGTQSRRGARANGLDPDRVRLGLAECGGIVSSGSGVGPRESLGAPRRRLTGRIKGPC
jgi:serine/threonine protein kinase